MIELYERGGFIICVIMIDMEFEKVADNFVNVEVNIAEAQEHTREAERTIRTVKEYWREIINKLPYSYIPSQITSHLIYFVIMWLNAMLSGNGILHKYSPREIFTGRHLDFKKHCKIVSGSYVEAHDEPNITNNMNPRNHKCTYL